MSQDNFWERWMSADLENQKGATPAEQPGSVPPSEPAAPKPAAETAPGAPAEAASDGESDTLAAWMQLIETPETTPQARPEPAATQWPPAQPVDPFTSIQQQANTEGGQDDWDFLLEPDAAPDVPAAPRSTPGADPFQAVVAPAESTTPAPEAPTPSSPFGPPPPPVELPREAREAAPLRLEVALGRRAWEVELHGEGLIGRPDATRGIHPEIDLRLDDAVSRRHAKIFIRDGRYVLTDLNSTNGTRVNGQWVQPEMEVALSGGDRIEVGELTLIRVLETP